MSSPDNNNGSGCQIPQRQQSPEAGNSHLTDNGKPVDAERAKVNPPSRSPDSAGQIPFPLVLQQILSGQLTSTLVRHRMKTTIESLQKQQAKYQAEPGRERARRACLTRRVKDHTTRSPKCVISVGLS
ncbi:hypothetical protein TWF132_002360 [Orbilia oligospora]|nr:hypothetical protein TWF132_002360 [Orbilia oligospora]